MGMTMTSSALNHQAGIPNRYTGDGEDISPPLAWSGVPEDTKEFAIVCDDPDAPSPEPWIHWLIYKIPPQVNELPEKLPTASRLESPVGTYQR
jgi:Raf kinase inhibitor-like YbhB/YbcL family protein